MKYHKVSSMIFIAGLIIDDRGEMVQFVNEVVCLGVILDSAMSWKPPVTHITKKKL